MMEGRLFVAFPLLAALLALGGCGTAPQSPMTESAVPSGKARVYFFRDADYYDAMVWTTVSLDGRPVGASAPGSVFFRDVAPGTYRVEARSDQLYPAQIKTVALAAGTTTFIKVEPQPYWGKSALLWQGNTFSVAVVNPRIARSQIEGLTPSSG